ncbi:MAG: preQ(1) synthase [Patescibacteria group bacterium]|nr:preQ(1) synthase [Patescibacteria group bacterium]
MGIEELTTRVSGLDTLENKNKDFKYVCIHEFPELTAVCPVTRLPDFYIMKIEYEPDERLIELKSFKLFLNSFRDVEILHEEITNDILNRLIRAINPRWARIEMKVNVRGGIDTIIKRHWDRDNGDLAYLHSDNQ